MAELISNDEYSKIIHLQKLSNNAVVNETRRLDSKKASIDAEEENARRLILLNQSYRDRQQKYLVLMTLFLLVLGLCLAVIFLQERVGYSSGLMDWFLIFIVGIGGISAYLLYMNILSRDKIDFSKLDQKALLPTSNIGETEEEDDKRKSDNITSKAYGVMCRGQECCAPGYQYNTTTNKCVIPP